MIRSTWISRAAALVVAAGMMVGASSAFAADAEKLLEQAQGLYEQREDLAKVNEAIAVLDRAVAASDDDEVTYQALILKARSQYWLGIRATDGEAKKANFKNSMDTCNVARELIDDYAEAYYFYAIALGRWAEVNGVLESLNRKDELIRSVEGAMIRETQDGKPGRTIDYHGPNRTLGRVLVKLPDFAGHDKNRSLRLLEEAVARGRDTDGYQCALNIVYLADTLTRFGDAEKNRARQLLRDLLRNDERSFNPNRVPETKDDFADARKLLQQLGG